MKTVYVMLLPSLLSSCEWISSRIFKGKEEIKEKFFKPGQVIKPNFTEKKHHITNILVNLDDSGRTAWATAYFIAIGTILHDGKKRGAMWGGWCTTTFVKREDGWKISRNKIDPAFDVLIENVPGFGSRQLKQLGWI